MNAYQNFLDFFSMHNKERLDGLSESYFTAMTPAERAMVFDYLLGRFKFGGTEESVHGLFRADPIRAVEVMERLLDESTLSGEAQIAAAWNLRRNGSDTDFLPIFIRYMSSPDRHLREKAAYFVPAEFSDELKTALQAMIRTETEQLPRIHAVDALLECYGVSGESVGDDAYKSIYRGLHSEDLSAKERAFKQLDALYE